MVVREVKGVKEIKEVKTIHLQGENIPLNL